MSPSFLSCACDQMTAQHRCRHLQRRSSCWQSHLLTPLSFSEVVAVDGGDIQCLQEAAWALPLPAQPAGSGLTGWSWDRRKIAGGVLTLSC